MNASAVVLGTDALAVATTDGLRSCGVDVLQVRSYELPDLCVSLRPDSFEVERRRIGAILLREPASAMVPLGFASDDRGFVLAELSATWLAATQLDQVLAINRFDAETWFDDAQWPVWRTRLARSGVQVSPLSFGDSGTGSCWRPYVGGSDRPVPTAAVRRALGTALAHAPRTGIALFACGDPIGDRPPPPVQEAARSLRGAGVQLKSIAYDAAGRVATVDVLPAVADHEVEPVASRVTAAFYDHLRRR